MIRAILFNEQFQQFNPCLIISLHSFIWYLGFSNIKFHVNFPISMMIVDYTHLLGIYYMNYIELHEEKP